MKKIIILICLVSSVVFIGGWLSGSSIKAIPEISRDSLIRFHVLANSDNEADQLLKRQVRDGILARFTPVLGKSPSLEASRQIVKENLEAMEKEAARIIALKGKDYPVKAEYGYFNFPVKSYGELTLPAGRYEAVRIVIGKGEGSNWWCVLFPPLCFVDITTSLAHSPDLAQPVVNQNKQDQEIKPLVKLKLAEVVKDLFQWVK